MTLLDLPNELLLPIFSRLIGQFIHALVLNHSVVTHHLWDPVTTLQLVCKPTRSLVLSICRQVAVLPAHDPLQTVDPARIMAPYRGLAFNSPVTHSTLLADSVAPPLLQAYTGLASALEVCSAPLVSLASFVQAEEAVPFLVTAEHFARQVNPSELSELVLDRIEQLSELIVWEKRISKWITAMVQAKSRPNEITEELQAEINDCLHAFDDNILPQRILHTSNLSVARTLAKHARKVQETQRSLEYLDLSFPSPSKATSHTTETVSLPVS